MREDPWYFATRCVVTQDEKDRISPIKKFPSDMEYLKLYFRVWQKERLVAVPKSRRMFMSWANTILYLWDTLFHVGRFNAFVSKKEEDADTLLERCKFILENIPPDVLSTDLIPKWRKTYCKLEFPEINSKIWAFPSGADQLRMHGLSGVLNDEMAFQEDAKEMYSATFPTIETSGKFTAISSPSKGFFHDLVFDELDGAPNIKQIPSPMQGVEMWRNGRNQFFVFQAHYTADPAKRDGYGDKMRATMPLADYKREYELTWESFVGKAVYPDWNKEFHGSKFRIPPEIGLPLLLGNDQGLRPGCIVCQLQGEDLVILKEYTGENIGAERFAKYVKNQLAVDFPEWSNLKKDIIMGMDPTAFNRRDVDERTYASAWKEAGFNPQPGENSWEKRKKAVEDWLIKVRRGRACMRVNLQDCPILVEGFDGGYRYSDKAFEVEPTKPRPIKDKYSEIQDGLQYILTLLNKKMNLGKTKSIPSPSYSWSDNSGKQR